MNTIGNKIKKIRVEKGFTQEQMGKVLKVTQSNYGRLEKDDNRLTIPTLKTIADCLGVSIYELIENQ